jgi:hypothetical protein
MTFTIRTDQQDAALVITQTMIPDSRTSKGSKWSATCTIDGRDYSAESRSGAPHALARVLFEAGIPDQPVTVVTEAEVATSGYRGDEMSFRSLEWMASRTLKESGSAPLRDAPFAERPDLEIGLPEEVPGGVSGDGQKGGESPSGT